MQRGLDMRKHANAPEIARLRAFVHDVGATSKGVRERPSLPERLAREGLQLQAVRSGEVLDVGGEERQIMRDGGGADQGSGQAHAVR